MEKTHSKSIKIAVVGPESSGKSTLCKELSSYYKSAWVPEFARTYLVNQPDYSQKDLDFFVTEQRKQEEKFNANPLFCDTDSLSIKVWSLYKYGDSSEFIHQEIIKSSYNLHLLLSPDLAYEEDPLREDAPLKNRLELFHLFEQELKNYNFNYHIINGVGDFRTKKAISAINQEFSI